MRNEIHGDTEHVGLWYPRCEGNPKFVQVELMDVRAADGIRIHYDFERDGYVIEQASTFSWPIDDTVCDPDWQEVAFVPAWAREKPGPADALRQRHSPARSPGHTDLMVPPEDVDAVMAAATASPAQRSDHQFTGEQLAALDRLDVEQEREADVPPHLREDTRIGDRPIVCPECCEATLEWTGERWVCPCGKGRVSPERGTGGEDWTPELKERVRVNVVGKVVMVDGARETAAVDSRHGLWVFPFSTLESLDKAVPEQSSGAPVTVRPLVSWFAEQMEIKLRENDHKGGWEGDATPAARRLSTSRG